MEGIRSYILSIVTASVICAIAMRLMGTKGTQGAMIKLITGLFLTFTVIRPLADVNWKDLTFLTDAYSIDSQQAAQEGQKISREALRASIKARTEAYILDKADGLQADVEVVVTVSEDEIPVPTAVTVSGSISPLSKRKLSAYIADDLGINKEDQTWT